MIQASKSAWMRRLPIIVILAVAVVGSVILGNDTNFEFLRDNREALIAFRDENLMLTAVGFVLFYIAIVAFSLPGALVATLTSGFLFGTPLGALLSVTGATVGATLIFLAARHGFGDALRQRMDASQGSVGRIKRGIDENQWSMLFFIRLVPVVPFFVANLLPALLAVPLHRYVVSTFLGIIPGAVVYASAGAGLGEILKSGETPDLGLLFEPHILLPLLGLAGLSLLPVFLKPETRRKRL